jgi:hypothetical protein
VRDAVSKGKRGVRAQEVAAGQRVPRGGLYTDELAHEICERLAAGESLNAICKAAGMPSEVTVRNWAHRDHEGFSAKYTDARARGYLRLADEIIEISDDAANDVIVGEDGREIVQHEIVARARLRVDSRKWMLSKMLPKVFGDKVGVEHSGEVGVFTVVFEK